MWISPVTVIFDTTANPPFLMTWHDTHTQGEAHL